MPRVAEILPASPRVHKKNAIVTFVGVDNAGALPEETRTAIETLAADGQVLVGVSNLFHKPSKLYVYYQQALQAMCLFAAAVEHRRRVLLLGLCVLHHARPYGGQAAA